MAAVVVLIALLVGLLSGLTAGLGRDSTSAGTDLPADHPVFSAPSDVTLTYSDGDTRLTALNGVDLDVPAGTITAVTGPPGSGKSSLVATAATLITPDRGTVVIDGIPTSAMSRAELTALRRKKIGIVFQKPNLIASLIDVEQLQLIAHLAGRSPAAAPRPGDGAALGGRAARAGQAAPASALRWAAATGHHRARPDERPRRAADRRADQRAGFPNAARP